eukprot:GGOE01008679.1.p1 GENE.GGOE01008679.1~~GGOE01008679.1.p1  ORF type:complete len:612 (-),score=87.09 GGOE01008679.1:604-2439(-)
MLTAGCASDYELLKSSCGLVRQVRHIASQQVCDVLAVQGRPLGELQLLALWNDLDRWRHLQHRNVIVVMDVFEVAGTLLVVMAMTGGTTLSAEIALNGMLNEPTAHRFFKSIVAAMAYCIAVEMHHCNLNPDCIYLDPCGTLKVGGFGLCHLHPATPYIAPELQMSTGELTGPAAAATDVWSLALILHEMLTGRVPLVSCDGPTLPQHLSPPVGDLLCSMLRVSPEDRCSLDAVIGHHWFQYGSDGPPMRYSTPELQLSPSAMNKMAPQPTPTRLPEARAYSVPRKTRQMTGKGCLTSKIPSPCTSSTSSSEHSYGSPVHPQTQFPTDLPMPLLDLLPPQSMPPVGLPLPSPTPTKRTPVPHPLVPHCAYAGRPGGTTPKRSSTTDPAAPPTPGERQPRPPPFFPKRSGSRRSVSAGAPRTVSGPPPSAGPVDEETPVQSDQPDPCCMYNAPVPCPGLDRGRRKSATALSSQSTELGSLKLRRSQSHQPSYGGHLAVFRSPKYRDIPSSSYGRSRSVALTLNSTPHASSPQRSRSHYIAAKAPSGLPVTPSLTPPSAIPDRPYGTRGPSFPGGDPSRGCATGSPPVPARGPVVAMLSGVEDAYRTDSVPFL